MRRGNRKVPFVLLMVLSVGYGVGAFAATQEPEPEREPSAALQFTEKLAPYDLLENGLTAGSYRIDTPLDERPDLVPAQTSEGLPGYLKVEDFDPRVSDFSPSAEPRELTPSEVARLTASRSGEASKQGGGQIWAPVYGRDGSTVIGRALVSSLDPTGR